MRGLIPIVVVAALIPVMALAQDDSSMSYGQGVAAMPVPEECPAPQIADSVQMIHLANRDGDLVPVTVNGMNRNFLLDTGSYSTQIQRAVVEELGLPIQQTDNEVYDLTGHLSRDQVPIKSFTLAHLNLNNVNFLVSPDVDSARTADGFFAMDYMQAYDIDMDFGTDKLTFYSQDHCPRVVPYWAMTATAVVPITLEDNHIIIPATLDGKTFRAWVDTGSGYSALSLPDAQSQYGLTMGDAATPEAGGLNEDPALKTYAHVFKSLTFGDVAVADPHITIIPDAMAQSLEKARQKPPPAGKVRNPVSAPELIVGMDVLRKLHLYMSLAEGKMYISRASEQTAQARALQVSLQPQAALRARFRQIAAGQIDQMNQIIAEDPENVPALNERCYMRAAVKADLDSAQTDCDLAVRLRPRDDKILDSRAFVLYQQGKYQDALAAYNQVLAVNARSAPALLMRGYAKGMLGDSAGKQADIAAAVRAMPDIQRTFQQYDISY